MRHEQARRDERRRALVVSRRALRYDAGANRDLDRPAHVRSGSGLAQIGGALVVVQDDAAFLAVVRADEVGSTALPEVAGARTFDDAHGNKSQKLDLEACVVRGDELIAFGSGSSPARERLVVARRDGWARIFDAGALYAKLRAWTAFSGSELNLEGACLDGGRLLLFQRGNGAPRDGLAPIDATCALDAAAFFAWVDGEGPAPEPADAVSYDLGRIGTVRLTFTDATVAHGRTWYLAVAEDSPDAVRDGPVTGLALGTIAPGDVRYALVHDESGPVADKAEGIVFDPADPARAWVVVDRDDPEAPSELLEIRLEGDWA